MVTASTSKHKAYTSSRNVDVCGCYLPGFPTQGNECVFVLHCRYRSSSSIHLVDLYFEVATSIPGLSPGLLSINPAPSLFSLNPSWSNPSCQFNSATGAGSTGSLNIAAVSTLGMWAWADSYDVFNTAVLTGQQVSTAIRGMEVRSYARGSPDVNNGDALSNCMLPGGTVQATAALASADGVCMVHVNAVNAAPAKGLAVSVAVAAGMPPDPSTQVRLNACCCGDALDVFQLACLLEAVL